MTGLSGAEQRVGRAHQSSIVAQRKRVNIAILMLSKCHGSFSAKQMTPADIAEIMAGQSLNKEANIATLSRANQAVR